MMHERWMIDLLFETEPKPCTTDLLTEASSLLNCDQIHEKMCQTCWNTRAYSSTAVERAGRRVDVLPQGVVYFRRIITRFDAENAKAWYTEFTATAVKGKS